MEKKKKICLTCAIPKCTLAVSLMYIILPSGARTNTKPSKA